MRTLWGNRSEQLCGYINGQLWGYNEHIMGHTACIAFQMQINDNYKCLIVLNSFQLMIRDENMSYLLKRSIIINNFILMLLLLHVHAGYFVEMFIHVSQQGIF